MKKLFIVGLLSVTPFCLWAETYEFYPESCQEAFNQIDDLVGDPSSLKEKYNLSVNALEQVKWSAIEEIEANPNDEDIICGMVAPALEALIAFKQPKSASPETEKTLEQKTLEQKTVEPTLEK